MDEYGYADWDGNDQHFMGWAGHRRALRPRHRRVGAPVGSTLNGGRGRSVVPHGRPGEPARRHVVPDGPAGRTRASHPDEPRGHRGAAGAPRSGRTARRSRRSRRPTTTSSTACRRTSTTTCSPSRPATASGAGTSSTGSPATSTRATASRGVVSSTTTSASTSSADELARQPCSALERSGAWDDTIVVFTSDHGDMCGSHGLRSRGPFVYDEIMRVPST